MAEALDQGLTQKLRELERRSESLSEALSDPGITADRERFTSTSRAYAELQPIIEKFREYTKLQSDLEGTVSIDGLCVDEPCRGTLALRYLTDQTLRYSFEFQVASVPYRYVGEKVHIRPWNLPWSHTTCYGRLVRSDTGELVSTSVTHFRWRSIPAFLASLRLA